MEPDIPSHLFKYRGGSDEIFERDLKSLVDSYSQNLVFDGSKHQTVRINEIVENIMLTNNKLDVKKNWISSELSDLSSEVELRMV